MSGARIGPRWRSVGAWALTAALFAAVASALLGGVFVIFSTIEGERRQRAQVVRTTEVLDALRTLGFAAVNAETGQRGYLLTLDRGYLVPYQIGAATYPGVLRRLDRLLGTEATPRQRALLARAQKLADSKFAEMAETVALIDDRRIIEAEQGLRSDEGQGLMVELRATLAELARIERDQLVAASARSERFEERVVPLLAALLAVIVIGLALGLWQLRRFARAEAVAAQAGALAEARDRADLLAGELNHRVKNLFAVVLAIVKMSGKGDPAARPTIDKISDRLHALVRSHQVTQGEGPRSVLDLRELIETALAPYRLSAARCRIEGEPVTLRSALAVPLGLVLHELVTNAVKYGSLANAEGTLEVEWTREGERVRVRWREDSPTPIASPAAEGFGTMLIASSARQIEGTIERSFHTNGVEVTMEFPVG